VCFEPANRDARNTPESLAHALSQIGEIDCPVFDGIFPYCQILAGGSIDGAYSLIDGTADIAVNWSGGFHHSRADEVA